MLKTTGQKLREEGRAQGLEEGLAQGLEEGRAQGLKEGREQGIEEGLSKGIEKGQAEMLRLLLRRRFGDIPDDLEARLKKACPATLKRLFEAALDADDISDLLNL